MIGIYPFNMEWVKTSDQIWDPLEDLLQPGHVGAAAGCGRGSEKQRNGDPLPSRQRDRGPGCWGTSAGLAQVLRRSGPGGSLGDAGMANLQSENGGLSCCREIVVLTSWSFLPHSGGLGSWTLLEIWQEGWSSRGSGWSLCEKGKVGLGLWRWSESPEAKTDGRTQVYSTDLPSETVQMHTNRDNTL